MAAVRIQRECPHPGCRALISGKATHCPAHAKVNGWGHESRGTAESRGYDYKWRKLREAILRRDEYLCQECLRDNRATTATDVDHIINKAQGGTDDPSNLQSLCGPCHKAKTSREAHTMRYGDKG